MRGMYQLDSDSTQQDNIRLRLYNKSAQKGTILLNRDDTKQVQVKLH